MRKEPKKNIENPIDKDKVTDSPDKLPYPHHVGSLKVEPNNESLIKHRSQSAMLDQTNMQLEQIQKQMELLKQQAGEIRDRVEVSDWIYQANCSFEPLINHTYHLYKRNNGKHCLSLIGPDDWGKSCPFAEFIASVTLLADHTWRINK